MSSVEFQCDEKAVMFLEIKKQEETPRYKNHVMSRHLMKKQNHLGNLFPSPHDAI